MPSTGLHAEWRKKSACLTEAEKEPQLANAFTDESRQGYFTAKRICRKCPVKIECLMDALGDKEAIGYRAGFFFMDGTLSAQDNRLLQEQYGVKAKPRQKKRESKTCVDQDV